MWSGIIFLLLAIFNIRTKIINAVPKSIQNSLGAGIGLFIALVGLKNAGVIVSSNETLVRFGAVTPSVLIFLITFLILVILVVRNITGAMIISIIVATLIAACFGRLFGNDILIQTPKHIFSMPDFSLFFQLDLLGALKWSIVPVILTFLFINIFDSSGTLIGLAHSTNWIDEKTGEPKRMRQSLLVDSTASSLSGLIGVSPATVFVESASGISVGGRTGIVAITAGILFLPFMFLSPLINMVPLFAVAPILVTIGCFMMRSVGNINWNNLEDAIPAFLTVMLIPFGFSISEGVAWGIVAWYFIKLFQNRKELSLMSSIITFCCILIIINNIA
jgi:AGZA family xanthine/uracil permease-like MFS transporter